jgi:uncharacterized protein YydD (DUF2326 family)
VIRRIFSDLGSFKALRFHQGLNVLLADKSPGATDRQTRNGAGKTSFVELVHFLTGSNCGKDSIFRSDALGAAEFGMEFDVRGVPLTVFRSGRKPSDVFLEGDVSRLAVTPRRKAGRLVVSNIEWRLALGEALFSLPVEDDEDDAAGVPTHPTFRSLIAYFARRERKGGLAAPTKQHSLQKLADQQMALSYLFGLDWTIARDWEQVRARENELAQIKRAYVGGAFGDVLEPVAALRTQLAVADERVRLLRESLSTFRVLEQYEELEKTASQLTAELAVIADENAMDRLYLEELEEATRDEAPPQPEDLERLFQEAGVVLPGTVRKRFDDVRVFHDSIVRNRRSYLLGEVEATRQRVQERDRRKGELDRRRAEVMSILQSHGALEHFTGLQLELARGESQAEVLRQKFRSSEALEAGQVRLAGERARLRHRFLQTLSEQTETLGRAFVAFESVSRALYEQPGSLTIEASDNGPVFAITISGEKSKGISNMQVFCFDMVLMQLCHERRFGPKFLVHDSHLFDGVDDRQIGTALHVGATLATKLGFQYIVTMNSDEVPHELPVGFDLRSHVLPVKLTDASEDGGLFGVRFD